MAEQDELDRLSQAAPETYQLTITNTNPEERALLAFAERLINLYRTGKLRVVGEGEVVVKQVELDELRQRMPWAGGRSPITCGVSGSISAVERKRKAATAGGEHEG